MHRSRVLIISLAVVTSLCLTGGMVADAAVRNALPTGAEEGDAEATTHRGDASLSGEQPGPSPAGDPVELWHLEAEVLGPPIVASGAVYLTRADDGRRAVVALDAATGAEIWRVEASPAALSVEVVAEGTVLLRGWPPTTTNHRRAGFVVALEAATGAERWRFDDPDGVGIGPVAAADGAVFIQIGERSLVALDPADARERWLVDLGPWTSNTPVVVVDGIVYVGAGEALHALDAADGTVLWQAEVAGANPAFSDGLIFIIREPAVSPFVTVIAAVDAATGENVWTVELREIELWGGLTVADGAVYFHAFKHRGPAGSAALYALDAATGVERWTAPAAEYLGVPTVADGVVYVGGLDEAGAGGLYALDAATGAERWFFVTERITYGFVAVVAGVVYVVGAADPFILYAIGGSASVSGQAPCSLPPPTTPSG